MPPGCNPSSVEAQVIAPALTVSLVYDDAGEGIRWLVDVLGFRVATCYKTPDGDVAFAELVGKRAWCSFRGGRLATTLGRGWDRRPLRLPRTMLKRSTICISAQWPPGLRLSDRCTT